MSCIGLDVGNESCRGGVARQGGIDIFLNDQSTRETPTIVSFASKERVIGNAGAASSVMNLRNTVWQVKRLIGKKFQDPEVQSDLRLIPCRVSEGRDGRPLVHVSYLGEERSFTPTELLGMILAHLKSLARKSTGVASNDCVMGVPAFMDDSQRRAYLDAAAIAGMKPLKLIHETTAAALSYGLYKSSDLPEDSEAYVVFVDVGHAHTQAAVAGFQKGQVRVLSYAFDRCLGGRDFDEVLFEHFAAQFSVKYRIEVLTSPRACQRLRAACEKLKRILSANPEAPISIECLMDDKDVTGYMTREEFEKLSVPLLQKLRHVCERAVAESELAVDSIYAVEVIGSASRLPAVSRVLFSAFRKEPRRTLNASESIARGCALQGAMLSPTFRVRPFEVSDYSLFPRTFSWLGPPAFEYGHDEAATPSASLVPQIVPGSIVFPKGMSFPLTKSLTFWATGPLFEIRTSYADTTDLCSSTGNISASFTVGPANSRNFDKARLKLSFSLNQDGVLTLPSATLVEEEESNASDRGEGSPKENKPHIRLSYVPVVESPIRELTPLELQVATEKEFEMQLQDRVADETKEVRNALEALVYDLRNKFYDKIQNHASEMEKHELLQKLQNTETWLYGEGDNESKGVYSARLADLKQHVNLLEERWNEENACESAFAYLLNTISKLRITAATAANPRHAQQVLDECYQAESWAAAVKQRQEDAVAKHSKPVICAAELRNRAELLDRYCHSILNGDLG